MKCLHKLPAPTTQMSRYLLMSRQHHLLTPVTRYSGSTTNAEATEERGEIVKEDIIQAIKFLDTSKQKVRLGGQKIDALDSIVEKLKQQGVQAAKEDVHAVFRLLMSSRPDGVEEVPEAQLKAVFQFLKNMKRRSVHHIQSGGPSGTKTEFAYDIPRRRPTSKNKGRAVVLVHEFQTKDGKSTTLEITRKKSDDTIHDENLETTLKTEGAEINLKRWLDLGMLPKFVDSVVRFHSAGQHMSVANGRNGHFKQIFNNRDARIREYFPIWYLSSYSPKSIDEEMLKLFSVQGSAAQYYQEEYEIFCEFVKAYEKMRAAELS